MSWPKLILSLCFVTFISSVANSPTATQQQIEKIQQGWKKAQSYQAEFSQTVTSKLLGTKDTTKGLVTVKKPNKFRWEQTEDGGLQLINGKELLLVQPKAQRGKTVVTRYKNIGQALDPSFIGLLSGTIDLQKTFKVTIDGPTDKSWKLKLKSKKGSAQSYLAEFSKNQYLLTSLSFETDDTTTEVVFKNIKTNVTVKDSEFTYKIGKDDIVYDQ